MFRRLLAIALAVLVAGTALVYVHLTMPGWYARWWYPLDHRDLISRYSEQFRLDPALVAAVIYEESSFDDGSTSSSGAQGLMQLMPGTARWIAGKVGSPDPTAAEIRDPDRNIYYGCWYLRYLLDRYGGSEILALAAYNGGTENVDQWVATAGRAGHKFNSLVDIPYPETREYVQDVDRTRDIYLRAYPDDLKAQTG